MQIISTAITLWQKTLDITAKALKADVSVYLLNDHSQMSLIVSNSVVDVVSTVQLQELITTTVRTFSLAELTTEQVIETALQQTEYCIFIQPIFNQHEQLKGCLCTITLKSSSALIDQNVLSLAVNSLHHSFDKLFPVKCGKADNEQSVNLQNFINAFPEHIWIKNPEGRYLFCNKSVQSAWNKTSTQIVGKLDDDLFDPETVNLFKRGDEEAKTANKPVVVSEYENVDQQNNHHCLETIKAPLLDVNDNLQGVIGITRKVGRNKFVEAQLLLAESVFENTIEGVLVTNRNGDITEVNNAFTTITGFTREEAIGQNPRILNSGKHDFEFFTKLWNTLVVNGKYHGEIWNKRKSGEIFPQAVTINTIYGQDGSINFFVAVFADISNQKQNEEKLASLAHYDSLTKLPNRVLLLSHLQTEIDKAILNQTQLAAIFFDIDFFKHFNDSLGHDTGDKMLVEVGQRLSSLSNDHCVVGRLSSDEFVILLSDITHNELLARRVSKIKSFIEQPFKFDENPPIRMTISMGVSLFPNDSLDTDKFAQNADTALHIAKQSGRNNITFYDVTMTLNSAEHLKIQNALHEAIQEQNFHLVYQPKLSLITGELVGLESLIRWEHQQFGVISPVDFIPIAEKTGLIHEIGLMVLRMACQQGKKWLDAGYHFGRIAVNVACLQFQRSDFIDNVESILIEEGFPAHYLELEMTESCMMYEPEKVISDLKRLGDLGIQLSVDDFGTGYSSLSYLKKLPINVLKIDQSFVSELPHDSNNTAIAKAIIVLGHALKFKIIAEGVETKEQATFLLDNGCDQAQGYYFSKPKLAEDLTSLFTN